MLAGQAIYIYNLFYESVIGNRFKDYISLLVWKVKPSQQDCLLKVCMNESILCFKKKGTKYIISYVPHVKNVFHVSLNYIFYRQGLSM